VNQSFAKKFMGTGNPVGQKFRIQEGVGQKEPYYEIVGIVRDT
jgi:hypothetical protein